MKRIEVRLPEADIARLDQDAAKLKTTRADLARDRLTKPQIRNPSHITAEEYYRLVTAARRRVGFCVDARQMEQIVSVVIRELVT